MSELDDAALVRAAQAGDHTGPGLLLERYRARLTRSRSACSATDPPRTLSKTR